MRPVDFGSPPVNPEGQRLWYEAALRQIEEASREDALIISDSFTVSNHTATRTLDVSTATLTDVANVLATLLDDFQKRGPYRDDNV